MAFPLTALWRGLRHVERLLELEKKHGTLIERLDQRLEQLTERVQLLEVREEVLITRAGTAASGVASQHVSDLARLVGGLDERVKRLEAGAAGSRALPPPEA